jgi:cytochrome c oxidase subunit 3
MSRAPAMQFDDLEQQRHAAELGMWTFLATEVLFFGGLFTLYTVYRVNFPDDFAAASRELYTSIGAVNTGVLLISSLTMALAVHASQIGAKRVATIALGMIFLALKGVEYTLDYHEKLVPGVNFHYDGKADARHVELFMILYFVMTGLHALHMLIGVGCVSGLAIFTGRGEIQDHATTVEMIGLYWHFVDIVWIFLLPLLYLI